MLYSNQRSLPPLPVPALKDTCRRFMLSVRPILDDKDFNEMDALCKNFMRGEGRSLQRLAVLKSMFVKNYVRIITCCCCSLLVDLIVLRLFLCLFRSGFVLV